MNYILDGCSLLQSNGVFVQSFVTYNSPLNSPFEEGWCRKGVECYQPYNGVCNAIFFFFSFLYFTLYKIFTQVYVGWTYLSPQL